MKLLFSFVGLGCLFGFFSLLHFGEMQHLKNKRIYFFYKGQNVDRMGLYKVKELVVYTENKLLRFNLLYDIVSGESLNCCMK